MELNFREEKLSSTWSNQACEIVFTTSHFAWYLALNEAPYSTKILLVIILMMTMMLLLLLDQFINTRLILPNAAEMDKKNS